MEASDMRKKKVVGDLCPSCDDSVEWYPIPDSLASACEDCGFVRIYLGEKDAEGNLLYDVGVSIPEWLQSLYEPDVSGSLRRAK